MRRRHAGFKHWLGWLAIAWLLALGGLALLAYGSPSHAQTLDQRTRTVASQFRCLVCQGESVAESPSGFAQGIRSLIRRRLQAGQSEDQIKAYLVSRYGDQILEAPPQSGIGNLAWLAPPLLVLGGLGLAITLILDWRNRGRAPVAEVTDSYLERVRAELAAGEQP